MNEYELVKEQLLLFFLTEFTEDTPASYVETAARGFLRRTYSSEWIDGFWEKVGKSVISDLVEEYNRRITDGFPIHFTFVDDEGRKICGWSNPAVSFKTAVFQQALLRLKDAEFERLSGRILHFAGCTSAWATPISHDQGIDAFGYFSLFSLPRISREPHKFLVWILVQAKHYDKEKVCSSDIREFLGSGKLAKYEIYATEGKKYQQLKLRPFSPIALVLVTSGEVKRTARLIAEKAGILLVAASDLCAIFSTHWSASKVEIPASPDQLVCLLRQEADRVPATH